MALSVLQVCITAFYAGCYLAVGLVIGSLGPTLPPLAQVLNTTEDELSAVFFARGGGWLSSSFASGVLYDKVPGHPLLAVAMVFMGLGPLLIPFAVPRGKIPFMLCFVLLGIGGGCVDVGANTLVAWQYGDEVGPHIQFLHFGFAMGGVIAPIIVAQVLASYQEPGSTAITEAASDAAVQWTYWALAVICIPFVIIGLFFKSPKRREAEAQSGENVPKIMVVYISWLLMWYVSAEISFGGWVSSYAINLELASDTVAPYINSVFWGAITAGRLLAVPLSSRMSAKRMIIIDIVGATVTCVLLVITQPNIWALWVLSAVLGLFLGSVFATAVSYPTSIGLVLSGKDTMWFVIGAAVGEMALPSAMGPIFHSIGYEALPYAMTIFCVFQIAFMILTFRVPDRRKTSSLPMSTSQSHVGVEDGAVGVELGDAGRSGAGAFGASVFKRSRSRKEDKLALTQFADGLAVTESEPEAEMEFEMSSLSRSGSDVLDGQEQQQQEQQQQQQQQQVPARSGSQFFTRLMSSLRISSAKQPTPLDVPASETDANEPEVIRGKLELGGEDENEDEDELDDDGKVHGAIASPAAMRARPPLRAAAESLEAAEKQERHEFEKRWAL